LGIHIFQDIGKLDKGGFCFVRLRKYQSVEGVQCIEKEVRIDLRLVESQFRLVLFRFNLLFGKNLPEKLL